MKINITRKEYRKLLELLMVADSVLDVYEAEDPDDGKEYDEVIQKFLSYAKEMGCENLIEHDAEEDEYYPTSEFEDNGQYMEIVDKFAVDSFWETLISRLAERDLRASKGVAAQEEFSFEDMVSFIGESEEQWADEFAEHGLQRITVNKK